MARKPLEKQIAELKFDAKIYASKTRRSTADVMPFLKTLSKEQIGSLAQVSDGFNVLGLSLDDGLQLAIGNRLPQALQDAYGLIPFERVTGNDCADRAPIDELYPRWQPIAWSCSCGEQKTLWHKTHFTFHDRNQIYCRGCRKLAGWGSDQWFKGAQAKGEATRIVISHPLDYEAFTPPLLVHSPPSPPQTRIRAERSQSQASSQNVVRAKRTQLRESSS